MQDHTLILGNIVYDIYDEIVERKIEHESRNMQVINGSNHVELYFIDINKDVDASKKNDVSKKLKKIKVRKDIILITRDPPIPYFRIEHEIFGKIGLALVKIPFGKGSYPEENKSYEIVPFIEMSEEALKYILDPSFSIFKTASIVIYLFSDYNEFVKVYEIIQTETSRL